MKKVFRSMGGMLVFFLIATGCSRKMASSVGKSADVSADFKDIKTYSWTSDIDKIPNDQLFVGVNGVYVFNNESARKRIKDAIQYELDAHGYKKANGNNADMQVSFSILEKAGKLQTTNGYVTLSSGEKVLTKDNISYTDVKPGTLIIDLVDAKKNKQIWQGFASGILAPGDLRDESKIRQAVSGIFNQFKYNNHM